MMKTLRHTVLWEEHELAELKLVTSLGFFIRHSYLKDAMELDRMKGD